MLRKAIRQANRQINRFLPRKAPPTSKKYPQDFSAEDIREVQAVEPYTMTSPERIFALRRAVEHIVRAKIPGEIVECGVWKGGSMMAIARCLLQLQETSRGLHLFDTFEGMTPPQEVDRTKVGSAQELLRTEPKETSWFWAKAPLDGVKEVMRRTNYSGPISYVKGPVEETIPAKAPAQIALLRLDTDWYQSTYHEMVHLYPKLSSGGILIIDDYGFWEGARQAVDQYLHENRLHLYLHRIDDTGRLIVKP